jgi:hypothetical protein
VSGEEYARRQLELARQQQRYDHIRQTREQREDNRWEQIEQAKKLEEEYWALQRQLGIKVRPHFFFFSRTVPSLHAPL